MRTEHRITPLARNTSPAASVPNAQVTRLADLIEPLWQDIALRLQNPVAISITQTKRQVAFMDILVYEVDYAESRVCIYAGNDLTPITKFDLLLPVRVWGWLDRIVEAAGFEGALADKLVAELKGRVRQVTTLRQLSLEIRTALALEAHPAFQLALRCNYHVGFVGLFAKGFNQVWQHLDAFQRVALDNHKLLPVLALALATNEIDLSGDPIAQLRAYLINRGLSPAGWRLLAKMGYRGIRPALERFGNADLLEIVVIYCDSLAKVGLTKEPSRAFIRVWLADIELNTQITKNWHRHPTHTLRTAFKALEACKDLASIRAFTEAFLCVDQWVLSKPEFDKNQRKASWSSLVGRARTAEFLKDMEKKTTCLMLPASIKPFEWKGYRCVPITVDYELYLEGLTLRHCAYSYRSRCLAGTSYLFSIRLADTDKRVATVLCNPTRAGWVVRDARVFANRKATGLLRQMAGQIARRLNLANLLDFMPYGHAPEPVQDCLMDEVELWPVSNQRRGDFKGYVEWGASLVEGTDSAPVSALSDDDEDPVEDDLASSFAALVAHVHGERIATVADWDAVYEEMRNNYHSYAVAYCTMITEDHLPPPSSLLTYLEDELDEARFEALCNGTASLTQDEWDQMRVSWIEATLKEHDSDDIHTAGVLEISDDKGRSAYLLAEIGGYSFTQYIFELHGVFQFKEDAFASIQSEVLPEVFARREGAQ